MAFKLVGRDYLDLDERSVGFKSGHNRFNLSAAGVEQNNSDLLN